MMRVNAISMPCLKQSAKGLLASFALAAGVVLAPSAHAQVQTVVAPVWSSVDNLGVDVTTGQFNLSTSEVVIGQLGAGGLSFGRHWIGSGWRDNVAGTISSSGSVYTVSVGASSERFTLSGGVYTSQQQMGSTLTFNSGTNKYTYTTRDGTVMVFNKYLATAGSVTNFWSANEGSIESITRPNGEFLWFAYSVAGAGGITAYRPQTVSINTGFVIHFTYANDAPANTTELTGAFLTRTKTTGMNIAVYNCGLTSMTCSDSTGANWPYVIYGTEAGGIQTVTDRLSQTTRYVVSSNLLTQVRLPTSSTTARTEVLYSSGKVSNVTSNLGGWFTTDYTYADASGIRTTTSTPYFEGGATITKTNIANGWVTELWADSAGTRKTVLTRDSAGRVTRTTRADGDYTDLTYDGRGNVTQVIEAPKTGSGLASITTTASFPVSCSNAKTCNKPDSTTDARGFRTDYTYDSTHGGVLTVTLPAPSGSAPVGSGTRPQTRYTYADASTGIWRLSATSACATGSSCGSASTESVTTFAYDGQRRVTTTTARAGDSSVSLASTVTYTPQGDIATVDGPQSGTGDTSYAYYDDMRRLRASVTADPDAGGSLQHRVARTTYNADGNPTIIEVGHVSNPSSWASMTVLQRVDNTYDLSTYGILTKTALSSGGTTYAVQQFGINSAFRRCAITRMNPSEFASLPADGCTADTPGVYGPDRGWVGGYNAYREGVTSGDGAFDGYGNPSRPVQTVAYDASSGEAEYLTDAGGNETKYEYDGFGRLVKTIYPSTSTPGDQNASDYEQLTYDAYGRLTGRRGRDGQSFAYSYDNLGRVLTVTTPGSQPDITYTYDNFGRVLTGGLPGHTLTYTYDALGRVKSEKQGSRTVSYQYDAGGRRSRLTWPDSFYVTYEYNTLGEMTAIKENGGTALATFAYDNMGRRTALTRSNGGVTGYAFDGASNLIDLAIDATGSVNDVWTDLSYNPAGQIVSKTINNTGYNFSLSSAYNDAYADNGLNQYTSAAGITPTYDTRGNTTYDGTKSYTYDYSNRMIAAGAATFAYDPAGRLLTINPAGADYAAYVDAYADLLAAYNSCCTGQSKAGWGQTHYTVYGQGEGRLLPSGVKLLYDGADIIAEYNVAGAVVRRYVHGPGIDEPLVWFEGAGHSGSGTPDRRHLYADERGSIIAVEGSSTTKNTYDEYGVPGSGNTGRFQFTGQLWLSDAGLYHYKARAYNPDLGRFMQPDPIGYADGMNIYAYVKNDPVNRRDPSGLGCIELYEDMTHSTGDGWHVQPPELISRDCTMEPILGGGSGGNEPTFEGLLETQFQTPPPSQCPFDPSQLPLTKDYGFDPRGWNEKGMATVDPFNALFVLEGMKREAEAAATNEYPGMKCTGDACDAFRHAYFAFRLGQHYGMNGFSVAYNWLNAHEVSGQHSSVPAGKSPPPIGDILMDAFNNRTGLFAGVTSNGANATDAIRKAAASGCLRTAPY